MFEPVVWAGNERHSMILDPHKAMVGGTIKSCFSGDEKKCGNPYCLKRLNFSLAVAVESA